MIFLIFSPCVSYSVLGTSIVGRIEDCGQLHASRVKRAGLYCPPAVSVRSRGSRYPSSITVEVSSRPVTFSKPYTNYRYIIILVFRGGR